MNTNKYENTIIMKTFEHCHINSSLPQKSVIAIGNFDGLHLGHQLVIKQALDISKGLNKELSVITFEPHPKQFFRWFEHPFRITPQQDKARLIAEQNADNLLIYDFDKELASIEAEPFVEEVLLNKLKPAHIVVGADFRFGQKATGDASLLKRICEKNNVPLTIIEKHKNSLGIAFSSTEVRAALHAGDLEKCRSILGRAWEIEGTVEHGFTRGRTIGFPTANINIDDYIIPPKGVYAVKAGLHNNQGGVIWHNAIANFGSRPTFDGEHPILEVHIFDFNQDIYDKKLRVQFIEFLRIETKFANVEELKKQIQFDVTRAKAILSTETL